MPVASQRMQGPRALFMFIFNLAEVAGECPEFSSFTVKFRSSRWLSTWVQDKVSLEKFSSFFTLVWFVLGWWILYCTAHLWNGKLVDRKVLGSHDLNVVGTLNTDYFAPLMKGRGVIIITALSGCNFTAFRGSEPVEKGRRQAGQRMSNPNIHPE